ncbi:uncharacterized protein Z519_09502 [Cladophialophora bantiana CBS 173.52]|uniref:3-oxoacyl-[acyl-carrier protein] reductase n=1 Tax=Cladophialophora bantiana (strain ATCC 10958 / CBS 173.52 / CDC B-1940 / NIH 8579) TaxID=1442370 RepID=A0A0D2EJ60_CLAB1|nr:uncharacterized protein Z519_09502 [Cladophialophora bantiana CBS 173.52]KIW90071.1 hypothetical protein Z519_09502 [Cladophialophora bantiana CBS 173.52]
MEPDMVAEQTLKGKVAIVSGSARGIGAAVCVELASRGALVIVNYPWPEQEPDAERVLDQIARTNGSAAAKCRAIKADLSTLDGPRHLVNETVRLTGGKVDILVNNAGIAIMRPLKDLALDQWDSQVNLNARGMVLLTQAVLPHLTHDSRIVNVSSVGARQGYVGRQFTTAQNQWWNRLPGAGPFNAIEPGPTNTHGFNHAGPSFLEKIQPMLDATPMGSRMAEPSEIAYAIAFLCEKRSGWITGACIPVNGGFLMP